MSERPLLLIGTIVIVLFLIGLGFGTGYRMGESIFQLLTQQIILEKSDVIQSYQATARGEITKISGRTITLTEGEDTLSFYLRDNAKFFIISSETQGADDTGELQEIEFKDITTGNRVLLQLELNENKDFEVVSLVVTH